MQEEVTRGAVTLIVDGAKLSEQVFEKAVKKFLEEIQKSQKPKIYRGRQSLKQLASQNAGLVNIEISDKNIKAFSRVAKKYHVDFALKKDTAAEQPRYLVFFKSRDADAITAAFQEFASRKISREEMMGIASIASIMRIITLSTTPPAYPAIKPTIIPTTPATSVEAIPTTKETLAP